MKKLFIFIVLLLIATPAHALKIQLVSETTERRVATEAAMEISKMYGGGKRDERLKKIYEVLRELNKAAKKDRNVGFLMYVLEMKQPNAISCGDTLRDASLKNVLQMGNDGSC